MMITENQLATWLLIAARVAALVFVTPGFNHQVVPWRIRALVVFLLTIAVTPVVPVLESIDYSTFPQRLLHEGVVGASLAFIPAVMIWGFQVAASACQQLTGLGDVGSSANSDDLQSGSATERLLLITALTIFFAAGGHRQLIEALLGSFQWLGPGQQVDLASAKTLIVDLLAQSFAVGVRAMCPVMASLVMSMLALAAINRVLPQVGYFAVGMNVQVIVLLGAMLLFVGGISWLWEGAFADSAARAQVAWQELVR